MRTRLLVADDQATVREALAALMALSEEIDVIGTASNGKEALRTTLEQAPDVVLMDLEMSVMGGVEATEQITRQQPRTRVVALTTFEDDNSVLAAMQAGAIGYLTKDAGREAILRAVQAAAHGRSVLDLSVQRRLLELAASGRPRSAAQIEVLTSREREILRLIGTGLRNQGIAETLTITEATVKTHINNIFAKANLASRADAVRLALMSDL
jgi:DNA-binding NarL/FixJ family response regulator